MLLDKSCFESNNIFLFFPKIIHTGSWYQNRYFLMLKTSISKNLFHNHSVLTWKIVMTVLCLRLHLGCEIYEHCLCLRSGFQKLNVFEESDRLTQAKFYFYCKTSIVCLDLLYIIRSLLESNEAYLYITTVAKMYL